jgi:hypothetical protein
VTDLQKAVILEQVYSYTNRFSPTQYVQDTSVVDSLVLRLVELEAQIEEENRSYDETLLLIDLLGESDGSTSSSDI